ncbi:MAG TPA: peptidoglycan-binding protein, partial [Desulfuromonadales bacterium]
QNLSGEVLEQLRLLTNLETSSRKLLQIILIGQPELRDQLARTELRQVAQRITARYHLGPLERSDLADYLQHRLAIAGSRRQLFTSRAVSALYRASRGIPRLVNVLADRALLGAYAREESIVGRGTARRAVREVFDRPETLSGLRRWVLPGLLVSVVVLAVFGRTPPGESPARMAVPPAIPAAAMATKEAAPELPVPPAKTWEDVLPAGVGARRLAENDLLRLWGLAGSETEGMCRTAQAAGLDCLTSVGSLALLGQLDRPAILHLRTAEGGAAFGTLARLQDEKLELLIGGKAVELPAEDLPRYWLGEFTLIWRPMFPLNQELRRGDQGTAVAWLARSLPDAAESPETGRTAGPGLFDNQLETRVKQFQLRYGLLPDGIAGPKTLILLDRQLGTPGPRLAGNHLEP